MIGDGKPVKFSFFAGLTLAIVILGCAMFYIAGDAIIESGNLRVAGLIWIAFIIITMFIGIGIESRELM